MIVQKPKKELANNPFEHGDLQALHVPCLGLQQAADTRSLSTNFYVIQKMSFQRPCMLLCVLTNPFLTVQYLI